MIGKIRSENISRRGALLGSGRVWPRGGSDRPKVVKCQGPDGRAAPGRRKVALALQGGGSHGAFTWGVLDRLLDDATIDIIGVTGTSAGAMNGAVLVDGLVRGGPEQARAELRRYWEAVGEMPGFGSSFLEHFRGGGCHNASRKHSCLRRGHEEKLVAIRSAPGQ